MFNKNEITDLSDAILLQAGINPEIKRSVDEHNINAKKEANELLPKFEGLLVVIHDVTKKASINSLLPDDVTEDVINAINNSMPGEFYADGFLPQRIGIKRKIPLEKGVQLSIQDQLFDNPIEKYIKENLPENIVLDIFMRNNAYTATIEIMSTIEKLKDTINGTTSITTNTNDKINKVLSK